MSETYSSSAPEPILGQEYQAFSHQPVFSMPWFQSPPGYAKASDWAACRETIKVGSKSFYAASRVLPAWLRDDAYALYAFCRISDDAVDIEDGTPAAIRNLKLKLDRVYAGQPADDPMERAFADVVARHNIPRDMPDALLEGLAWDVDGVVCHTLSDVYVYSSRVASSVGAMMALLMGARTRDQLARACDLGVAMQLTNIARDVGEDAREGRLYLPRDWMREEGVDPDAWLRKPVFNDAIARVVARLLEAAEAIYRQADSGIATLPTTCRPGIFAARHIYRAIGSDIAAHGFDSISRRARSSGFRKALLMARSLVDAFVVSPNEQTFSPPLRETAFLANGANDTATVQTRRRGRGAGRVSEKFLWTAALFADLDQRERSYGR